MYIVFIIDYFIIYTADVNTIYIFLSWHARFKFHISNDSLIIHSRSKRWAIWESYVNGIHVIGQKKDLVPTPAIRVNVKTAFNFSSHQKFIVGLNHVYKILHKTQLMKYYWTNVDDQTW